jgi:hypothetical protein
MKAPLNLLAHASIVTIFLTVSVFAMAEEARVKIAVTETSRQTIGPAGEQQIPPRGLQVAQECQSGRDDCMIRPQEQCGPGLNDCLSLGEANCKDATGPDLGPPPPNTAGLDNALRNPNLPPEQRAKLESMKATIEASRQRADQMRSRMGRFQSSKCLGDVVKQCRATHC